MKKLFIIAGFILMELVSCKKDFIERVPTSTVTVDILYKTDKDFQDAVNGCYNVLQTQYQVFWKFSDLSADDIEEDIPNQVENVAFDQFTVNDRTAVLETSWMNYYNAITRTNTILTKIEGADIAVVTNKNRHIGEAKFIRALAYFDLVRIYGDVPMVTGELTVEQSYKTGREKLDKIYDEVIIPDLMDAVSKLPAKYTGADVGRATKGAAEALLGKVYLTRKDFVKAETALHEVTTMGYALLPNYKDLFDFTKDEHHSEYIFDIEYEEGISEGSTLTSAFFPFAQVIMSFYGITGSPGNSGALTPAFYAAFDPADKRRGVSVNYGVTKDGIFIPIPTTSVQASKSFSAKYLYNNAKSADSKANWKVIRYADVLLMYAEALNENGKTSEALDYVKMVRERAGLQGYTNLTQTETREKIYLERRLELSLEGHKWFDLVRTGRAYTVMQSFGMKPYMTVFPIPLSQIQIINNPAIFAQNPGY